MATGVRRMQLDTLRIYLIKIGGRVRQMLTKVRLHLASVIEDDIPKPSGLFEPKQDSVATVVEHPLEGGDVVAVTVEPEGGSPEPTSDPMLAAEVRT